jgi:hypothetical protein
MLMGLGAKNIEPSLVQTRKHAETQCQVVDGLDLHPLRRCFFTSAAKEEVRQRTFRGGRCDE